MVVAFLLVRLQLQLAQFAGLLFWALCWFLFWKYKKRAALHNHKRITVCICKHHWLPYYHWRNCGSWRNGRRYAGCLASARRISKQGN